MKEHGGTLTVKLLHVELDDKVCEVTSGVQPGLYEKLLIIDTFMPSVFSPNEYG